MNPWKTISGLLREAYWRGRGARTFLSRVARPTQNARDTFSGRPFAFSAAVCRSLVPPKSVVKMLEGDFDNAKANRSSQ